MTAKAKRDDQEKTLWENCVRLVGAELLVRMPPYERMEADVDSDEDAEQRRCEDLDYDEGELAMALAGLPSVAAE